MTKIKHASAFEEAYHGIDRRRPRKGEKKKVGCNPVGNSRVSKGLKLLRLSPRFLLDLSADCLYRLPSSTAAATTASISSSSVSGADGAA
jgi:hypothetical protein